MSVTDFLTTVGVLLTGLGLCCTAYELFLSRKVARAEFLLHLDEIFQQHNEIHARLKGGEWAGGRGGPQSSEDWIDVEQYMGLFERVQILIEDGIIDLDTFDRLYGYRLFYIVSNQVILQRKLVEREKQWHHFIKLWRALEGLNRDRQLEA